ncbi:hypothetical protein PARPLA_02100 [Rhodobacteraceae bacterium THAF1]|uniref:DoxX family protein n=1 Tax=Palleronia sp. THAF1 TaxID=2587842 RepID=UPI000F40BD5A|nr:DoxX family protein [Palleronia sp. THAF1]QFU07813.1 hypothetical protein FIU81_03905 [Palleronia sp. THAF1]VDC25628.1 hypothetical protein PARPLA_02100 [Rhodobacteraceae bacterium THAF1]
MTDTARQGLRAALTLGFLWFGLTKLTGTAGTVALYDALGFGQWPRFVTGTVETLGALALWSPLARLAALALFITMIVGFTAKTMLVGPPVWHIAAMGLATALLIYLDMRARRA